MDANRGLQKIARTVHAQAIGRFDIARPAWSFLCSAVS
jgi:hypothetical protein